MSEDPAFHATGTRPSVGPMVARPGLLEGVLDLHQALPAYEDPLALLDSLFGFFTQTVRMGSCQIVLQSFDGDTFRIYKSLPEPVDGQQVEWAASSPIFQWYRTTYLDQLMLDGPTQRSGERELAAEARRLFGGYAPSLCFPLMAGVEQIGLLLVGDALDRQPASSEARELLCLLAKNLNLSLNRLFLLEELQVTGRLPRGLAHDLQGLLTPISMFLQMARKPSETHPQLHEMHPVAWRNLQTISAYVREARTNGRSAVPAWRMGHLDEVVQRAVQLIAPRYREREVALETDLPSSVWFLMDEPLMLRLVMNLLTNALAATPAGKTVRVELFPAHSPTQPGDQLELRVKDEGRGMNPGHLARLLASPFGLRTTDSKGGGSGMGLSICRRIVRLHNGWMTLRSVEGEGTVAEVHLPQKVNR